MSFTRIKYDNDTYDLKLQRTTEGGDYRLFLGSNENCSKCLSYDGPRNAKSDVSLAAHDGFNQWPSVTEVESHLTNRVNQLTDNNQYGKNDYYKKLPIVNTNNCTTVLNSEDTRFTNPIEAYRGMDVTSYHYTPYLHVNSQCEILDDRIGLNSRLKIKDNFIIKKPKIIDQTSILPSSTPSSTPSSSNELGLHKIDICKN